MQIQTYWACREIARELQVNLLGYDYSGYGASTGAPSVLNTFADIETCLAWLLQQGKQARDIILYGQSVGSGPTCHLAATTPDLGGVILHSPLATGGCALSATLDNSFFCMSSRLSRPVHY